MCTSINEKVTVCVRAPGNSIDVVQMVHFNSAAEHLREEKCELTWSATCGLGLSLSMGKVDLQLGQIELRSPGTTRNVVWKPCLLFVRNAGMCRRGRTNSWVSCIVGMDCILISSFRGKDDVTTVWRIVFGGYKCGLVWQELLPYCRKSFISVICLCHSSLSCIW